MKHLINSILESAQDQKGWEHVLDLFVEETGVTSACIFGVHRFSDTRMGFYYSKYIRDTAPKEFLSRLEAGDDQGDHAAYIWLLSNPPHQFRSELELYQVANEEDMPPSYVRSESKKMGMPYRAAVALNKTGPWLDGLFTQSTDVNIATSLSRWEPTTTIVPLISQSLTLGRMFSELKQRYKAALTALDHLGIGVFLLDYRGNLVEKNAAAHVILDQADGISLSASGQLQVSDDATNRALGSMIFEHTGFLAGEKASARNMLAVPRRSGKYDYLISVRPLIDGEGELQTGMNGLFITAIDPERKGILSAQGLAALGQLTPSETDVATALVRGLKIADISRQREVEENTVRMQVKALLQKLRCRSQSDIIRVAAATKLPFVD